MRFQLHSLTSERWNMFTAATWREAETEARRILREEWRETGSFRLYAPDAGNESRTITRPEAEHKEN